MEKSELYALTQTELSILIGALVFASQDCFDADDNSISVAARKSLIHFCKKFRCTVTTREGERIGREEILDA